MRIDDSIRAKYYGGVTNDRQFIVIHYTANEGTKATAKGVANFFANNQNQSSAHFVVDEGDTVYLCVPENKAAWAVGGAKYPQTKGASYYGECGNFNSLSIEMVSHTDASGTYYIPDKTIDNTIELVKMLQKKYNIPTDHVIRHYDVNGKPCPWCWTNVAPYNGEKLWQEFKSRLGKSEPTNTNPSDEDIFMVRIIADGLNIRKDAGVEYPITGVINDHHKYTIVATKKASDGGTWGLLKSKAGWINISPKYVQRV